jgi:hypothetical protein
MAESPFGTTTLRRLWTFVGLWGLVIVSIISYITTPRAGGILSAIQIGGVFYYNSQVALNEFAQAATVPEWVVLLTYGILALILFGITVSILLTRMVRAQLTGGNALFILLGMTSIAVVIPVLFLFATLTGYTNILGSLTGVLQITPPLLTLSPVAVAIAIVTSYVP